MVASVVQLGSEHHRTILHFFHDGCYRYYVGAADDTVDRWPMHLVDERLGINTLQTHNNAIIPCINVYQSTE